MSAEMKRHTYFQLPVSYLTDRITEAVLLIRRVDSGRDRYYNLSNALPTKLTGHRHKFRAIYACVTQALVEIKKLRNSLFISQRE